MSSLFTTSDAYVFFQPFIIFSPEWLLIHLDSQLYFQTEIILEWLYANLNRPIPFLHIILNTNLHLWTFHPHTHLPAHPPHTSFLSGHNAVGISIWNSSLVMLVSVSKVLCILSWFLSLQVTVYQSPKKAGPVRPWPTPPMFSPLSIRHTTFPSFIEHHPRCFTHKTPLFYRFLKISTLKIIIVLIS